MKKILLAATLFSIIFSSCSDFRSELAEMKALQETIVKQFNLKDVNMKIVNGSSLDVSIINSPYNDSSEAVKQSLTDSIASVSRQFMRSAKLTNGTVSFTHNNGYGLINVSNSQSFPMRLSN